jgi:hypothetical protein
MSRRLVLGLAIALAVAACQSSGKGSGSPAGTSGSSPSEAGSPSEEPSGGLEWEEFTAPDGAFTVQLPGTPLETSEPVESSIGTATMTVWRVLVGGTAYAVIQDRFAEGTLTEATQDQLGQFRDGLILGFKNSSYAEEIDREEGEISGETALGVQLRTDEEEDLVIVFTHADDAYFLMVAYPIGTDVDSDTFFDSFMLND